MPVVATWHQLPARCTDQIAEFLGLRLQPTRLSQKTSILQISAQHHKNMKSQKDGKIRDLVDNDIELIDDVEECDGLHLHTSRTDIIAKRWLSPMRLATT